MEEYNPSKIEPKWAEEWVERGIFRAQDETKAKKSYILIEFPYPSGERLHVGHARSYSCLDAVARKRRMQGENVMFPFGWDAFGLPAENYAIKTGIHPAITTKQNIENSKKQAIGWGLSFDWSREVNTTAPNYYKWTQWIFVQLFKHGLAYKDNIAVNWCPSCKINLANEEVIDGKCERCGAQTERRMQSQWLLKITKYADRLLSDLDTVNYREDIKRQQVEWIGRSEGINIRYPVLPAKGPAPSFPPASAPGRGQVRAVGIPSTRVTPRGKDSLFVEVFTTRPDTNFGATFIVVAPEHPLVGEILNSKSEIRNKFKFSNSQIETIRNYVEVAKNKSELEKIAEGRKKTGVFTGLYAVNQLNDYQMPIWISDFVLATVGAGAVVGVPGHDKRDFEFAKEFRLPVVRVVVGKDGDKSDIKDISQVQEEEGTMVNSVFLNGMDIHKATEAIMDYLEKKGWGKRVVSYHLRDWVFSRQHYWGEPIPMIYCPKCARRGKSWFTTDEASEARSTKHEIRSKSQNSNGRGDFGFRISDFGFSASLAGWYPVPEGCLPVELPKVEKYQPSQTGESPLADIKEWVEVACPECGAAARRETDVMPNWAGSNWYYVAYTFWHKLQNQKLESRNQKAERKSVFDIYRDDLRYWLPVDWYNGGMEHTTLHLLYSRFIYKFLYDIEAVPTPEPYAKRTSHGVVLGPDGRRMSKSRGNVVNPDEIVAKYGADTLRVYEMFIGPFDQMVTWDDRAAAGIHRFLRKVWELSVGAIENGKTRKTSEESRRRMAKLVAKVDEDLEKMKFNTAVAALMEFVNFWSANEREVGLDVLEDFLKVLAPLAPFITEELWQRIQVSRGEKVPRVSQARGTRDTSPSRGTFASVHLQPWPIYEKGLTKAQKLTIVVQFNGKTRGTVILDVPSGGRSITRKDVEIAAKSDPGINKHLAGKSASRVIWVQDKLLNFVVG